MIHYKEYSNLIIKLNADFILPKQMTHCSIFGYHAEDILSKDSIDLIVASGLMIKGVLVFIMKPGQTGPIHVDGNKFGTSIGALNLVINSNTEWEMEWFEAKVTNRAIYKTENITNYISIAEDECTLIDHISFTSPTLVQAGVPHRIVNSSKNYRYCISIRFMPHTFEYLQAIFDEHFTTI